MYLVYLRNLLRCQSDLLQILQACLPAKATKYMPLFQPHGIIIRCCWSKKRQSRPAIFPCHWCASSCRLLLQWSILSKYVLTCFWCLLVWFLLPWFIILHTIGAALGIFCDLVHDNSKKHGSMGRKESEIVDNVFATMWATPWNDIHNIKKIYYTYIHIYILYLYPRWGALFLTLYIYTCPHMSGSTWQWDNHLQSM